MTLDLFAFKTILYIATAGCALVPVILALLWWIDLVKKEIW